MKRRRLLFLMLMIVANVGGLLSRAAVAAPPESSQVSGKVLIMAAASTTDAVEQIRADFLRLHPGLTIRVSYAASSTLARQIDAGAAADLFLSASTEWSDFLAKKKRIAQGRNLLSNELVIVVPADSKLEINSPADLAGDKIRRVALADPQAVPAGIYARQALAKLDLWKAIDPKATGSADVRQALVAVETGAAEAGIVYATDARASKRVRVAARIDPQLSDPIRYPLVLLEGGAKNLAARAFYDYLCSPAAGDVFRRFGFAVLPPSDQPKP